MAVVMLLTVMAIQAGLFYLGVYQVTHFQGFIYFLGWFNIIANGIAILFEAVALKRYFCIGMD